MLHVVKIITSNCSSYCPPGEVVVATSDRNDAKGLDSHIGPRTDM